MCRSGHSSRRPSILHSFHASFEIFPSPVRLTPHFCNQPACLPCPSKFLCRVFPSWLGDARPTSRRKRESVVTRDLIFVAIAAVCNVKAPLVCSDAGRVLQERVGHACVHLRTKQITNCYDRKERAQDLAASNTCTKLPRSALPRWPKVLRHVKSAA